MESKTLEELAVEFDDFSRQKTMHDADIHVKYSRAYDYYLKAHEEASAGTRLAFAGFVAGYLRAVRDMEGIPGGK
jgi:hypothetical protein